MCFQSLKASILLFLCYSFLQTFAQEVSGCFKNFEFLHFGANPIIQENSQLECIQANATLASITNFDQLAFVRAFLSPIITGSTYIGLERPPAAEVNDTQDPAEFSFIDGLDFNDDSAPTFALIRGTDPWGINNPSGGSNQRCVT